jgi:lysozyme family protein
MAGLYTQPFIRAVNFVLDPSVEGAGKLSLDPEDNGNWTGGKQGVGELRGTKWGISAAAYPQIDIPALSREGAIGVYWKDFWMPLQGDKLPPRLAICVFDCAVNQGVETAVKLLQAALQIHTDGVMGPVTVAAVRTLEQDTAIVVFLARRALRYAQSKQLVTYGAGWMGRLFRACMEASR